MRTLSVVGARPNFMKLAPLARELRRRREEHILVFACQDDDADTSEALRQGLGLPVPDFYLAIGAGTQAQQTAGAMQRLEPVLVETRPDLVLVYGDVNASLAAALVAAKLGIRVGHIEAGLRSRIDAEPEEINRILIDRLSDLLFTPSRDAGDNLRAEGIPADRVHFVGNVMIDSLITLLPRAHRGTMPGPYALVTLHRPANVDDPAVLRDLLDALVELGRERRILFPVHPRTRNRLRDLGWNGDGTNGHSGIRLLDPLPYEEMLSLVVGSDVVITDSGGLQEETSFLGIPCLTVRATTERPITCSEGTNQLVAANRTALLDAARAVLDKGGGGARSAPPLIERWDGFTARRIAAVLLDGARFD